MKLDELNRLEAYLKANGYYYKRFDHTKEEDYVHMERHQIFVFSSKDMDEDDIEWDVICHPGSYGYQEGLLEVMGSIVESEEDNVEGYLTADDIIKRLKSKEAAAARNEKGALAGIPAAAYHSYILNNVRIYYCSNCKSPAYNDTKLGQRLFDYCPYCGAIMKKEEKKYDC